MKTRILLFLVALTTTFSLRATDLIVEEFGTFPTYPSINAAITASANGDRIVIKNRAGDIPWIENIAVSKSLTFVSYTNNTQWIMQGTITLTSADGREINFIGMKNTSGNISIGTTAGANRGTKVNIMDCHFVIGSVLLNNNTFEINVVSSKFDSGYINFNAGNVIGNQINNSLSTAGINYNNSMTFAADTCFIVGNKLYNTNSSGEALHANSTGQVVHIRNNFVTHSYIGIAVYGGNTSNIANLIWNNTITTLTACSFTHYSIYITGNNSGTVWEVMNNVLDEVTNCSTIGIYRDSSSGIVNAYFNHIDPVYNTEMSGGFTFSGNNTLTADIVLDSEGQITTGSAAINGGNPAQPYYDLDLSVGDPGCYGGSYSLANFFPLFTGSSRVYFVKFPFNVRQGSTLNFKAYGFDR